MDIQAKISVLEQKIDRLERNFNFYFTGQERVPPLKELSKISSEVRRLMDSSGSLNNAGLRFRIESFVQKFTSYRIKWERGVRDIEEGRKKPGLDFFGGLGIEATKNLHSGSGFEEREKSVLSPDKVDGEIRKAAEQFVELSKIFMNKSFDGKAVEETLRNKISTITKKYGNNFSFNVSFDGEKVRIKPVRQDKK